MGVRILKKTRRRSRITRNALQSTAVLVSLLSACGSEPSPPPAQEPIKIEILQLKDVGDCLDRYFESDISQDPYFGKIGRDRMSREMRRSVEKMFSRMDVENSEYYAQFFSKAGFSSGDLMFPNTSQVIRGDVFPDENSKRLAGRRMAKSMRPTRFPNAYSLLHSMPKTAVVLVDRVNRSRSGMDVKHSEDIAGFFRSLLGFQNRMGAKQKVCDFVPNMSREQLNELDSYYSDKIISWDNPVTGQRVCRHCKEKIESGEFSRFGLNDFPDGMEAGFCR